MMLIGRLSHITKKFSKGKYDESLRILTDEYRKLLKISDEVDENRTEKLESILEKIEKIRVFKQKEKIKATKEKELEVVKEYV